MKISSRYLIFSLVIFTIHMVMCIEGKLYVFHLIISPLLFLLITGIIFFAFKNAISREDFSIIAGGTKVRNKENEKELLKRKNRAFGSLGIMCQLAFFLIYFLQEKMTGIILLMITYIAAMVLINIVIDKKANNT